MSCLIGLSDIGLGRRDEFGGKAAVLGHLVNAGVPVPEGAVIPAAALWEALRASGNAARVAALAHPGVNHGAQIRALLWQVDLGLVEQALRGVRPWGSQFAVRSSSILEDRTTTSSAGVLTSQLRVGPDELLRAVRTVWSSGFAPLVLALYETVPVQHLSVIVQRQVDAAVAGVCFGAAPGGGPDRVVVECVPGTAEALLDGTVAAHRYHLTRTGSGWHVRGADGLLSERQIEALGDRVTQVEGLLGHPVDMEFAIEEKTGTLYTIQARPITAGRTSAVPAGDLYAVDPDRIEQALPLARGTLARIITRRADKHRYVRRLAWKAGIPVPGEWLIPSPQPDAARVATFIRGLADTDPVSLGLPGHPVSLVPRADIEAWLSSRLAPGDTVYAGEVHVGRVSGYAALRDDGSMVVEYVAGAVGGLKFGAGPFSWLVDDPRGGTRRHRRVPTRHSWALDSRTLRFTQRPGPVVPDPLDREAVAELRRIAEAMAGHLGQTRIEWIRTPGGAFMLWDLSLEESALPTADDGATVSAGTASGEALLLPDPAPLRRVLADRNVIPDPAYYDAYGSATADAVREELLAGRHRPIVVTPRPQMCLALLLGHVSGFIFEDAPLLCHLSIILREAGVPAVVSPGASAIIGDGARLELRDGDWRLAAAAGSP